ncbi:MAG: NAD(P)/FAD-dependent oxidoreductase [Lachnospiraceae bacterium]|nr:NAD(P)/FAD-dependent oxidoreductase [Lachnospiraceae bacterium]
MHVIVAGGGAAGMMAALAAAGCGHRVELLEQNEKLGKKIYITGKGRCNVTNDCEAEEFFRNIVSNEKFVYSAFRGFDNHALMELLEEGGCALKTERGNRVFPVSDHASDVTKALTGLLHERGVSVSLRQRVVAVMTENGSVSGVVTEKGEHKRCDSVILATGGCSYPTTGSDGGGWKIAEELGHTIIPPKPALTPLCLKEEYGRLLQGLALKHVSLRLVHGKKTIYEGFGEILFTHFGISGPLVLSASSYYVKACYEQEITCVLDLKPALTNEQLDKRLIRDFEASRNKQFKNALDGLLPARLIPVIIKESGILPEKKVNEISREERQRLVQRLKHWSMTVTGVRGFSEAIVTQGGIHVKQVNPSTMESKLVPGLYFAGEMLDVDALTGGFNLQLAWSTGYQAGSGLCDG